MAYFTIQATGRTEFLDGLKIGDKLKTGNGMQRVPTTPGVLPEVVNTSRSLLGQNKFQCSEVGVTAWFAWFDS